MRAPSLTATLIDARHLLGISSQGDLGERLGSSRRTGQRWERGEATPTPVQLHQLASLVYPQDPELAAEVAAFAGSSLEQLGLVRPPSAALPPPAPPAPRAPPAEDVIDAVVCAAAEAIEVMPAAVRPALLAAFRRARRIGLSVEAMERALGGDADEETKKKGAAKR